MAGEFLHGSPERPLREAVKAKPGLCWRSQDVGGARAMNVRQGELHAGSGGSPRERSVLLSARLEGRSQLSPSTSGTELQDLEFALMGFDLAWVHFSSLRPCPSLLEW